jgi:N-dimethylarginine dimethylaminohydrolase
MTNKRKFIMCSPAHYKIEYAINDWTGESISRGEIVNVGKSLIQWNEIYKHYLSQDLKVELVECKENNHELTFFGDSIFLLGEQAILSNYRFGVRDIEAKTAKIWARNAGLTVTELPSNMFFEGNAMAILWQDKLLMGYGMRTSKDVSTLLSGCLEIEVIPLELKAPFFHRDLALFALNQDTLVIYKNAFSEEALKELCRCADNIIEVDPKEAMQLACNSMVVGNTVLMSRDCANIRTILEGKGYQTIVFDTSEFAKVGGGVKCLTLEHYRYEARSQLL